MPDEKQAMDNLMKAIAAKKQSKVDASEPSPADKVLDASEPKPYESEYDRLIREAKEKEG